MIPGGNLLNQAMRLIASQTVAYRAATGRTENAIGYDVTSYASPVNIKCSVQPVARNLYEHMGLDFSKAYVTVFAPQVVIATDRDVSGDKITFNGRDYQCLSTTPWAALDGWTEILCVAV